MLCSVRAILNPANLSRRMRASNGSPISPPYLLYGPYCTSTTSGCKRTIILQTLSWLINDSGFQIRSTFKLSPSPQFGLDCRERPLLQITATENFVLSTRALAKCIVYVASPSSSGGKEEIMQTLVKAIHHQVVLMTLFQQEQVHQKGSERQV